MSALEDLKDRFKDEFQQLKERLGESAIFNQLKEKYQNLTAAQQKGVTIGSLIAIVLFLISIPFGSFTTSQEFLTSFEEKRGLIRELFKVSRDSQSIPQIAPAPSLDSLSAQVENLLRDSQLAPEQMKGIQQVSESVKDIPTDKIIGMLKVSLSQLNLRQIIDLGHRMQTLGVAVKLKDLALDANEKDSRYFDAVYSLMVIRVPDFSSMVEEDAPAKKGGRK